MATYPAANLSGRYGDTLASLLAAYPAASLHSYFICHLSFFLTAYPAANALRDVLAEAGRLFLLVTYSATSGDMVSFFNDKSP